MAQWKKVIVSGSAAQLASLTLDSALGVQYGGTGLQAASASGFLVGTNTTTYTTVGSNGTGQVVRTTGASGIVASGSFSGSFTGNGAGLTGVLSDSNFPIHGDNGTSGTFSTATETLKFVTASAHGFNFSVTDANPLLVTLNTPQALMTTSNVTFNNIIAAGTLAVNGASMTTDDTTFALLNTVATTINFGGAATTINFNAAGTASNSVFNGNVNVSFALTASTVQFTGLSAGTTDSVLILSAANNAQTRAINSRVWGSTLVDGSGSATRVAFWSDTDTIVSDANFTFGSNILTVNGSTFGQNVVVAGDFTVLGSTTILDVSNLLVEDKFILLNSGSSTGDGGIIIQSGSLFNGVAYGWDESVARWGFQQATLLTQSSSVLAPEAYVSAVLDIDGGLSDISAFQKNGNIKVQSGDIYIYA